MFARLKFESGVHRVQRVPETEASGRIHTSAATVAVLPEAEDVDVKIKPEDIRIDTMRASSAGGQHANTTNSAIRMTHVPSGIVVDLHRPLAAPEPSQAMQMLAARLYDVERQKADAERSAARRGQVGSGDRSERIRTYNFPQGRVTDHRINLTLYKLDQVLAGEALDEIVEALITEHQASLLAAESAAESERPVRRRHGPARPGPSAVSAGRWRRPCRRRSRRGAIAGTPALDARVLLAQLLEIAPQEVPLRDDAPVGPAVWAAASAMPRGGRPASRWRASSATRNSTASISRCRPTRWCRGRRPRRWSMRRWKLIAPEAPARIVDRRHRQRRDPARGARRTAERASASASTSRRARWRRARENAMRLGVDGRALFIVGDWLAAVGRADLILANPPYIECGDDRPARRRGADARSVAGARRRGRRPRAVRRIVADIGRVLGQGGVLLMEIGAGQGPAVAGIAEATA